MTDHVGMDQAAGTRRLRRAGLFVLALLLSAVIGACSTSTNGSAGGPSSDVRSPEPGGTLTVGLPAATDGWNPSSSQWAAPAFYVAQAIFDPLAALGADNKVHPYLAQAITSNSDFTQWTIKLRPNIKFHDGEPLNADAIVLLLEKDKASPTVGQSMTPVKSITKVDDLTVRVDTSSPWSAFPSFLATQAGFVAAPKQLNAKGAAATAEPIGTGPYEFKEWLKGDHLTVVKNPDYWRKGLPYLDQITFKVIQDSQSLLNSLQAGQIDFEVDSTATSIIQAKSVKGLTVVEQDLDQPSMVMLNTAAAPLDDVRVRQALAYATDVHQIIDRVHQGLAKPADGPYLPSSPWYAPSGYPTKPDLEKAKTLLAEYKKDKGITGDLSISLEYTPSTANDQLTQLLKTQWAQVGVDLTRQSVEQTTNINDFLMGHYQADMISYLGSLDPDIDSYLLLSTNAKPIGSFAINFSRIKDPKIDAAFLAARKTDDQAARRAQYAIVWKQLGEQVPYIWLSHVHQAVMYRNSVHGIDDFTLPDGEKGSNRANFGVTPLLTAWIDH